MLPSISLNLMQERLIAMQQLQMTAKNSENLVSSVNKILPPASFIPSFDNSAIFSSMSNKNNNSNSTQNLPWLTMQLFLQKIFASTSNELKNENLLNCFHNTQSRQNPVVTINNQFLTQSPNLYSFKMLKNSNKYLPTTSNNDKNFSFSSIQPFLPNPIFSSNRTDILKNNTNELFYVRRVTGVTDKEEIDKAYIMNGTIKNINLTSGTQNKSDKGKDQKKNNINDIECQKLENLHDEALKDGKCKIPNSVIQSNVSLTNLNAGDNSSNMTINVPFETVLYNGFKTVQINQQLFMPFHLRQICHHTSNLIEANLNPLTNLALKSIRHGDEIVLLNCQDYFNFLPNLKSPLAKTDQKNNTFMIDNEFKKFGKFMSILKLKKSKIEKNEKKLNLCKFDKIKIILLFCTIKNI